MTTYNSKEYIATMQALKENRRGNYKAVLAFYRKATPYQLRLWMSQILVRGE